MFYVNVREKYLDDRAVKLLAKTVNVELNGPDELIEEKRF